MRVELQTRLRPPQEEELFAELRAEGYEVARGQPVEFRGRSAAGITLVFQILEDVGKDTAEALAALAGRWVLKKLRERHSGDPGHVHVLYGPDGEVIRRVSILDTDESEPDEE